MIHDIQLRVTPQQAADERTLRTVAAEEAGIAVAAITGIRITRRSIDARQRQVMVNLTVRLWVGEPMSEAAFEPVHYTNVEGRPQVIVVGAGPGGLFAALRLIELGLRPVVIERGKDVHERKKDLARISREHVVDADSNYSFGEGGAGAYSDGKLYTRSKKRGSVEKILRVFCQHGASTDILVDAHPHIGTDRLPRVIENMRRTIIDCGGEVHFQTRMTELIVQNGTVIGCRCCSTTPTTSAIGGSAAASPATTPLHPTPATRASGGCATPTPPTPPLLPSPATSAIGGSATAPPATAPLLPSPITSVIGGSAADSPATTPLSPPLPSLTGEGSGVGLEYLGPVILATGHSARDVYRHFAARGFAIEAKGIAVGVRLEHPSQLIDRIQYHSRDGRGRWLPAAEYAFVQQVEDRGVYSFCMCPGGFVVPAATGPEQVVVNGMSPSGRNGRWSNSGMVVEIRPEDVDSLTPAPSPIGEGSDYPRELKMMLFQEHLERLAWLQGGRRQTAPAQRMADFVNGRLSADLPPSSYAPGLVASPLHFWLPEPVSRRLREGFRAFGRKSHGFLTNEATVIGVETRTSAPCRILRDAVSLQHVELRGLYPCGEGAGYAGGIVSAAIDGERCAEAVAANS